MKKLLWLSLVLVSILVVCAVISSRSVTQSMPTEVIVEPPAPAMSAQSGYAPTPPGDPMPLGVVKEPDYGVFAWLLDPMDRSLLELSADDDSSGYLALAHLSDNIKDHLSIGGGRMFPPEVGETMAAAVAYEGVDVITGDPGPFPRELYPSFLYLHHAPNTLPLSK